MRNVTTALCSILLLATASSTHAATITAATSADSITLGQMATIEFFLELDPTESASVFEGRFDLSGLGTVADASLDANGPTWASSFGNLSGGQAILSLTSNNLSGTRLLATMNIKPLAVGDFQVLLADPTFAAFDIAMPPFLQNLTLTNAPGDVLATVQVVPVPAAWILFAGALSLFGGLRRRISS